MKRLWLAGLLGALISSAASVSGGESPTYGGRLVSFERFTAGGAVRGR